jgi:ATP synthase subunit 6
MYQVLEQFSDHLITGSVLYEKGGFNPIELDIALKEFPKSTHFLLYLLEEIESVSKIDKLEWLYSQIGGSVEDELKNFTRTEEGEIEENVDFLNEGLAKNLFLLKKYLFLDFFFQFFSEKLGIRAELVQGIGNEVLIYKLTKINLYLILSVILGSFLLLINNKRIFGKDSFWSQGEKSFVRFIYNLIKEQTGIEGIVHLPLIATIFLFIILNNLIGLLPFGYTLTSHIMITFFLGFSSFLGITILIMIKKKEKMIELFLPKGVPTVLVPFLFIIEIISYIFRTISLSVRLFANMMAGHALLHILSNFGVVIISLKTPSRFFFIFPLIIVFAITFLELGIAILQAYVFAVLLTIYLNDVYAKGSH